MAFTRFTTSVANILGLLNKPIETPTQLKTKFDKAGTDIKEAVNGLMDELEDTDAATFIGAGAISESDDSDDNVQAKLEYLQDEIAGVSQGSIPDNSIAEAKLLNTYSATLAKKNGTLQTNLNAEKLGGKTQAEVIALAQAYTLSDTTTTFTGLVKANTSEVTLPTNAKFVLVNFEGTTTNFGGTTTANKSNILLLDITNKIILYQGYYGGATSSDYQIRPYQTLPMNNKIYIFGTNSYVKAYIDDISSGKLQIKFESSFDPDDTFGMKVRVIEVFGR